ncbi:hypothetical protein INR49_008343 [Caranx melampygus]|nr:hypothetical protein INR49_008343 [Caranx melampygus]
MSELREVVVVVVVVSAGLIAVGVYAKIAKEKDVVDTLTVDPALLLIIVGAVMFLITFLGCFGALRNATCLLKMVRCLMLTLTFNPDTDCDPGPPQ